MHPLENKIKKLLAGHPLARRGGGVVVGVSGGPDSVALLHLLCRLRHLFRLRLVAAYADHGLRPAETPGERELVASLAGRLGICFCTARLPVRDLATDQGLSIEDAARRLRYQFLGRLGRRHVCAWIAVGHTADDQAEEILLRLVRGTGRQGLSGMVMAGESGLFRPLLTTSKQEVLAYLADRSIPFCADSSNQDRAFLRNRVRLELLPYLAEHFNPNIGQTLRQTAMVLAEEDQLLATLGQQAYQRLVIETRGAAEEVSEATVGLAGLRGEPLAIQRRLFEMLLWRLGCPASFRVIDSLVRLAAQGVTNARLHLAGGLRVRRGRQRLVFGYPRGRLPFRGDG